KKKFGGRVQKVSINAGFTCPNIDGSKGKGGCTYCNNNTFNPEYCKPIKPISQQIDEGITFFSQMYKSQKYLAYFQAFTNTYAPLEELKQKYEQALKHKDVIGLVIATRPDCITNEILDYLEQLVKDGNFIK
ncbi:MAG TPA: TIGR01212 family radical SAM protein, partial [Flavobacteriales bacterium]|nr:TIGR01212 family radical SAM protein [Flavobacteriales bacterium]